MPSIIYTLSSGESDDDADNILPRVDLSSRTSESINLESSFDSQAIGPRLHTENEISDENYQTSENTPVGDGGMTNSLDGEFAMEPVLQNNSTASTDDTVDLASSEGRSSPEMEQLTDNTAKRKIVGTLKGNKGKALNAERKTKKQKLAEEKAAKKTSSKLNKIYKPGECMKYMNIEGHPHLWARWYMSDVPREAGAAGAHVSHAQHMCNPSLLMWTRTVPRTLDTDNTQVKLSALKEPCDHALYIAEAEELCEMVSAHSLSSHLSQMRQLCGCKLTLLVFQLNDYFKKHVAHGRSTERSVHSAPRRRTSNSNRAPMTEIDFELAITDLLVSADCDTIIANTASELALTIVQITKAIAETPAKKAKRACDEQAAFYMRGDNKKCVAVDKDGAGVGRLWQQMLATLPLCSLPSARAICQRYQSPLAFYESLQSPDSIATLSRVGVCRARAGHSRRVGEHFARKLHTLFTAQNGDQLID